MKLYKVNDTDKSNDFSFVTERKKLEMALTML